MATQLQSNTLLLVNISDGTPGQTPEVPDYYVHIRYSDSSDGSSGLSETPLAYIGLYVGIEVVPPKDPSKYTWSKYGGESNYIDIRYSNDDSEDKALTINDDGVADGLTPGSWMGVLVTDNPIVLETGWYPTNETSIKISDYSWTSLTKSGSDGIVYFLEYDYGNKNGNIYKFYTDSFSYAYTPTTITVTAKSRVGAEMSVLAKAKITCTMHYSYTDESNNEIIDVLKELTSDAGSLTINFDDYTDTCLEFLVFNCDYNGERILTEIKDIPFGTKKDMAKLALNANNIVASIQETKLTFDTNGLTIKNGGFKIIGSDGLNPVFYVNEKGDLSFTGELTTSSGSLGGWKINEYGLYIEETLT